MATTDSKKPEYKGPSEVVTAFGQSQVDSLVGTAIGGVGGAIAGAALHNQAKHDAIKLANNETIKSIAKAEGALKPAWHSLGRGGKAFAAAVGGMLALSMVGSIVGYFRGAKKASEAKKQFDEITTENALLSEKLETTSAQLRESKSFVESLKSERSKEQAQGAARA
ncbi:MAG: hypothetical protein LW823_06640 [Rickettsiales bacterium]|nr:hypothetical protein [Rickettsiales bacterium]